MSLRRNVKNRQINGDGRIGFQSSLHNPRTRRDNQPYIPPSLSEIKISTVKALVDGVRSISAQKQASLNVDTHHADDLKIWYVGDPLLVKSRCVAVVGARKVSERGAARAHRLGRELAESGIVVVSGLAEGVDTFALSSAISAGGRVIAIIGTPVDKAYPAVNKRLQEKIYRDHLLISQFEPGRPTFPSNFPTRNRLMATITDATAIIEASDTSGALHQAYECLKLNRWLFIANSIMEDYSLHWTANFRNKSNVRSLTSTSDVLAVFPSGEAGSTSNSV